MPLGKYSLNDRERMGMLSRNLRSRCVIQLLSKTVNEGEGGGLYYNAPPIIETYTDIKTVWCYVLPSSGGMLDYISAIRGVNDTQRITHEVWVRWESVRSIGAEFSSAFDSGYNTVQQMNPLKSDYYLFVKSGSDYRGRRFRIRETRWDERNHELIKLRCEEIEEVGTGYTP